MYHEYQNEWLELNKASQGYEYAPANIVDGGDVILAFASRLQQCCQLLMTVDNLSSTSQTCLDNDAVYLVNDRSSQLADYCTDHAGY